MARNDAPPFGRGETFYNGGTIDSSNLGGAQWEGKEWLFEDISYNVSGQVGAKPARTNRYVRCRCVRNVSGITLLPKRLAKFKLSGVLYGAQVDGYVCNDADRGYPIDEWLPSTGVVNNDLFWIVVDGPAMVLTDLAAASTNVISVGDLVIGLTAATSQATTAGRIQDQTWYFNGITNALTAIQTTPNLPNAIQNAVGRALSAKTTSNTNADLLVEVGKW